jgi:hypothetical protein
VATVTRTDDALKSQTAREFIKSIDQRQQFQGVPDMKPYEGDAFKLSDAGLADRLNAAGKGVNPKEKFGQKKPPLSYLPLAGMLAQLSAQLDGGLKYDFYNWRVNHIKASTYIDAMERHTKLYTVGEDLTRDTKIKNLGAVMACCAILLDAEAHGTLIDDRHHSKVDADLLHEAEAWVAHLKEAQAERERQKVASNQNEQREVG